MTSVNQALCLPFLGAGGLEDVVDPEVRPVQGR